MHHQQFPILNFQNYYSVEQQRGRGLVKLLTVPEGEGLTYTAARLDIAIIQYTVTTARCKRKAWSIYHVKALQ